jgi:hypothetical protein
MGAIVAITAESPSRSSSEWRRCGEVAAKLSVVVAEKFRE